MDINYNSSVVALQAVIATANRLQLLITAEWSATYCWCSSYAVLSHASYAQLRDAQCLFALAHSVTPTVLSVHT
jgi:hypothetical protein